MVGKHFSYISRFVVLPFLSILSGQCLVYSAGADPPPSLQTPENPSTPPDSNSLSHPLNRPGLPPLHFKKEDFVPIPEMAPIPLDTPQAQRKPLRVTIPNVNEVQQGTHVQEV